MDLPQIIAGIRKFGLEFAGFYYSSYPGFVVNNEDPKGQGRIQVSIPTLLNSFSELPWALPKGSFSGNNYGSQCLPSVGDMVWVEFQMGRLRYPLWTHYFDLKDKKPEEFKHAKVYGFKTPFGVSLIIDDTAETLTVTHPSGEVVLVEKEKTTITSKHLIIKSEDIDLVEDGADESIPLGNKLDSDLSDLYGALNDLVTILNTYTTTQVAAIATAPVLAPISPGLATMQASLPNIVKAIAKLKTNISNKTHLSQKAKTK